MLSSDLADYTVRAIAAQLANDPQLDCVRGAAAAGVPVHVMQQAIARHRGEAVDSPLISAQVAPKSTAPRVTPAAAAKPAAIPGQAGRLAAREAFAAGFGPMSAETKRGFLEAAEAAGKVPRLIDPQDPAQCEHEQGATAMARALGKAV